MMQETKYAVCSACGQGCGVLVEFEDGQFVNLRGDKDNPVYKGYSCAMGRRMPAVKSGGIRLLNPQKLKADGNFETIQSDQAMAEIGTKLNKIVAQYGPNAVSLYQGIGGIRAPAGQFAASWLKALRSKMRFDCGMIDQPGKFIASALHGGWLGGTPTLTESDTWLLVGSNPQLSKLGSLAPHGNPAWHLNEAVKRGVNIVVIDPRETEVAKKAAVHLQVKPGTDPTVLAGMLRVMIKENLCDQSFVDQFAEGFEELSNYVQPFTPDYVAEIAEIDSQQLIEAARIFANGIKGLACGGTGINMAPRGTLTEYLLLVINTVCGKWRREGERVLNPGVLIPKGPARAQVIPTFPGWGFGHKLRVRGLTNTAAGMPTHALPDEILLEGEGQVKALICAGGNPLMAWPDTEKTRKALEKLELFVVIDHRMTECAKMADYVIAPRTGLEEPSSTLSAEGLQFYAPNWGYAVPWAQYTPAMVEPPEGSDLMADWEFFYRLSQHMGLELSISSGSAIRRPGDPAVRNLQVDMQNPMTTEELLEFITEGSRVPLSEVAKHPQGKVFEEGEPSFVLAAEEGNSDKFNLANQYMMDELEVVAKEQKQTDAQYPFRMITRRLVHLMNSQGSNISRSVDHWQYTPVFMHPSDLALLNINPGDQVQLTSSHSTIPATVDVDEALKPGVVAAVHCYGDKLTDRDDAQDLSHLNMLLSNEGDNDNFSGIPRMSDVPVNILKAS